MNSSAVSAYVAEWLKSRYGITMPSRPGPLYGMSVDPSLRTLCMSVDMYSDDDDRFDKDPAEPRARVILGQTIRTAEDKLAHDPSATESKFIARIKDGDLKARLWDAISTRLGKNGPNKAIRNVVYAEIQKLWKSSPPSPADRIGSLLCSVDAPEEATNADLDRVHRLGVAVAGELERKGLQSPSPVLFWGIRLMKASDWMPYAQKLIDTIGSIHSLSDAQVRERIQAALSN